MFYQVKNKKKISTFALFGLFMIFSMLMTSTVEAQTLVAGQTTETIAIASPEFTDTVGDGVTPTDESTPSSTPTNTSGQELTPTDESITETTALPTEDAGPDETQPSDETPPVEQSQTPDPEQTGESTETPPGDEGTSEPSATPSLNPSETEDVNDPSATPSADPSETEPVGEPSTTPSVDPSETEPASDPSATPSPEPETTEPAGTEPTETDTPTTEAAIVIEETPTPENSGDRWGGSIWTTDSSCAPQDINHYNIGQQIWIRAANFRSNTEYNWSITEAGQGFPVVVSGKQTTDNNGYVCFYAYTFTGSDTINNPYKANFGWKNDNFNVNEPEPEDSPLTLSAQCQLDGKHQWTVSNPNNYDIGIYWNSTSGENGYATVPANQSTTFTSNDSAQTVTVYYNFRNRTVNSETVSLSVDSCIQPIDLELDYECTDDGNHLWTVSNSNDFALDFTWNSTTGEQGSGQVPAGQTATFETNSEAQTATIYYKFPSTVRTWNHDQKSVSVRAEACKVDENINLELNYECQDDASHLWTVTNHNNFSIQFTWYSNRNGQQGSGTVPANDTATFTTNNKAQTVTIVYSFENSDRCGGGCGDPDIIRLSVYAEECKIENKDLQLNYVCEDDGDHLWTVTNHNNFDIEYEWVSNVNGQHGQGTVPANDTDSFSTNSAAQTVTVNWTFENGDRCGTGRCGPEVHSVSVEAEVCEIPMVDLTLSVECLPNGQHKWTVYNGNDFPVDFDWESTDNSSGSDTVSANGSAFFTTSNVSQSATITWNDDGQEKTKTLSDDACQVPLEKLDLSVICLTDATHQWTVSNPNNEDIDFSWSSTSGQNGSGTAPANDSTTFITSIAAQNVTITYLLNGGQETKTKHADKCEVPDLDLSFICGYPDDEVFTWKVTNNNDFAVNFTWKVDGSSEADSGNVPANSFVTFTTSTGPKKVKLYVLNYKVDQKWSSDPCLFDLKLSYECQSDGSIKWTVKNVNNYTQSFDWSSTIGQSGSGSVSPYGETSFTTNNGDQTVTLTYHLGDRPDRTISKDAELCMVGLTVEPVCGYPDASVYYWKVTNPNPFPVDYSWIGFFAFIPLEYGGGTAASGVSYFSTSANINWVKISWPHDFDTASITESCLVDLSLDYQCKDDGTHTWTVTNNNPFAQSFTWSSTSGESGSGSVGANNSTTISTDKTAQTITVAYTHSPFPQRTVSLQAEACKVAINDLRLEYTCLADGSHHWTVYNDNNFAKDIDWSSTSGETGSDTVPANSSVSFNTDNSSQTMTVRYSHEGEQKSVSLDAERCLIDLKLEANCLPDGSHQWTLINNNDFALDFDWSSTSGESGSGTVNANSSETLTSDYSSQTLTVSYIYDNTEKSVSLQDDVCTAPDLSLTYICGYPSDTTLLWKVTNNNDFAINYTWSVEGDSESGSGTVAANSTSDINTSLGNKTVNLYVLGQQVDQQSGGETCLNDLVLEYECLENGDHFWTVSNSNDFAQYFTWSSTNGDSGSDTVPANGSVTFTTNIDLQTVTIVYQHDSYPTKSVSVDAEACQAPGLLLTYICGYPSDTELIWRVRNSHDFDVPFTWDVYGSTENGSGVAVANSDTFFTTSLGNKTVRIFVYSQLVNTKAGGSTCKVDLELDYSCLVTGLHEWTVVNGNSFDQEFDWSSTSGESGTLTAPANSSISFITNPDAQIMTITYQNGVHPEKTVTVNGEVCKSPSLVLSYKCGYPTDENLYWYVTNPYSVDIDFTWEVVGDSESGSATALANADTLFTTSAGLKTVKIMVEGYEVDSQEGGEVCMVKLDLSYSCLSNGAQVWTVKNNNKDDHDFTWSSTSGEKGSGTVLAGDVYKFTTDNIDQTITLDYKFAPFPAQTTTASGEVCKISTPEPPSFSSYNGGTCVQWLAFHTMRDGNMEVYRLDGVEGIGDYVLINLSKSDAVDQSPSRSPNNAWVAFQSNRDENFEIYYTDSSGNSQIRLTNNEANDINPIFSPDNVHIAFQSDRNDNWDLYMVDRLTGEVTQLTNGKADEINPFFSSDKNWLVYQSNQNGNWDIYTLNIETGMEYQITDSNEDETDPAWSPTSNKIAYLSPVDGILQLFVIDTDGQNKMQITNGDGDTLRQAWSHDGTRIAYQSSRDGNVDIYTYDLRDGKEYRVTTNANQDIGPTWDCSDAYLAYTGDPNNDNMDIYQVYWKGGASSYLTNNPAVDKWSEWSPTKETASRND